MFHHVYSDLVLLAKSKELKKSAYDMMQHYLELKIFLSEVEESPEIVINCYCEVFPSEPRLYMNDSKFNHRIHSHTKLIQDHLFQSLPEDKTALFSIITSGASFMQAKLCITMLVTFYQTAYIGNQMLKLQLF